MNRKLSSLLLSGFVLAVLPSTVSSLDFEFYRCLDKSAPDEFQNVEDGVDFTCQYSNMTGKCYEEFVDGTSEYIRDFILRDAFENTVKRLCQNRQDVIEAFECAYGIGGSSESEPQSSKCKKQQDRSAGKCKRLGQFIECNPVVKATVSCFSRLVNLLKKNGINVPCASTLSSGTRPSVSTVILFMLLIIPLNKFL